MEHELGAAILELKRPHFLHHNDFTATGFGVEFDFILAQSIFSHAGKDIIARSLSSFRQCLHSSRLVLATFIQPFQLQAKVPEEFSGSGWVYPGIVAYRLETIASLIAAARLVGSALPWFHPRQTWFAIGPFGRSVA